MQRLIANTQTDKKMIYRINAYSSLKKKKLIDTHNLELNKKYILYMVVSIGINSVPLNEVQPFLTSTNKYFH